MSWTKFYDFNEVLEIKPFADKKGLARDWKCKFDGEMLKFQTRDGCFLKQDGPLDTHDCGIYWLRVKQTCDGHPSGLWEYIGLSKNRSGSEYQRGIFGRLADHIRKIQYLPHRSKFGYRLYNKEYDDGKSDEKIREEKLLRTGSGRKGSTPLRNKYLSEFQRNDFSNCQVFRDHFRTKGGRDLIVKDCGHEFAEFFSFNKGELETFSDIETFMKTKIQIKFFVIPKMTKDKLYIEIAEAICLDAYKKKHKGLLPKLNIENEPKKLPWNGGDKFRDQDIQYVQKEINILNGLFL